MIFGKYINKYYLRFLWMLLVGLSALVLVDLAQLKIPEIYSSIIDGLNGVSPIPLDKPYLLEMMMEMFVIVAVLVIGRVFWRICFFGSAHMAASKIRRKMFDHCKDLPQEFYSKNKVGGLMSLFTNDINTVQDCFGNGILMFFDALVLGGMAIFKMFRVNAALAGLSIIPLVILLIIGVVVGGYMEKKWRLRQEAFSNLSDFSQESYSGLSVIKAFVKEAKELYQFKKLNKDNVDANVTFVKASTLLHVLISLLVGAVMCLILGVGGYLVYVETPGLTTGKLIEFMSYFNSTIWPMMAISNLIDMTSRGKASLGRISDLLDYKNNVIDKKDLDEVNEIKGEIEFKNLSFRYPGSENDVLSNISFKINAGENIGIVGKTGCGKTTLVDLILRLYNVEDNTLFIDGHDINRIPIKKVREYCAYVPQDNFLFSDTIEANIAFAFEEIDKEKVENAAKLADVHSNIVEFEKKYETILGERGVTISGGQKQRTSIARALMKDSSILILDDSVSAVDTKTEEIILNNLALSRKGKTTILIAHRISTIQSLDKVLFMEDGRIVAFDTHNNLYNNCESYRKMVDLQKLEQENGGNE